MTSIDYESVQAEATTDVVELASTLIRCDTTNPPGGELAAARIVSEFLSDSGIEADVRAFDGTRANLVARLPGVDGPTLLLSGHLDTVPADEQLWTRAPHSGLVADGEIHGRGSVDMKSAIAAMAVVMAECAARSEAPRGDLVLALTAGEEVDSCGARRLVQEGLLSDVGWIVVGEPTGLHVGAGHKGALWVGVETAGLAAHGSRPEEGVNSIQMMLDWLAPRASLEELIAAPSHPLFGAATLSLNLLTGGVASNIVPERCRALLDFRTLPGQRHDQILSALRARSPKATISVERECLPVVAAPDSALVQVALDAASSVAGHDGRLIGLSYLTDASVFTAACDATIILLGPGDDKLAHTADECLPVEALHQAVACYRQIAAKLLYD